MLQITTWGFRTFCGVVRGVLWILHVCKKQDAARDMPVAYKRLRALEEKA